MSSLPSLIMPILYLFQKRIDNHCNVAAAAAGKQKTPSILVNGMGVSYFKRTIHFTSKQGGRSVLERRSHVV